MTVARPGDRVERMNSAAGPKPARRGGRKASNLPLSIAASGVATALVYLAFTEDDGVGEPIRDQLHWTQILATASDAVPASCWDRRIDCGAASLWLLARSRACVRPTSRLVA